MRRRLVQMGVAGLVVLTGGQGWAHSDLTQVQRDFYRSTRLAEIRLATHRYLDLKQAKADGYVQLTGNVPLEGTHFYNPRITGFDYAHPAILLYIEQKGTWQLAALKYAVPGESPPAKSPFPGIRWRREEATCRYADWREVHTRSAEDCPPVHPETHSAYAAWQPDLWVISLWLWYPNPEGLFAHWNPLLAPFDDRSIPPDGVSTWDEWEYDTAYSTFNHNLSGYILLCIGALMLIGVAGQRRFPWMIQLWPVVMIILGLVVIYRSDPHAWPYGVQGFWESLADRKIFEHKLSALIVLIMGIVEWLRARQTLTHWAWGMIFPLLAIGGGIVLYGHVHPESNFNYIGSLSLPHKTEGVTAILLGLTWIVNDWRIVKGRVWYFATPLLMIAMALQLILYVE
ncbi:MAG: hypothetical protein ACE5IQ_13220 [Candidatus Methylomirabilales bacterium]